MRKFKRIVFTAALLGAAAAPVAAEETLMLTLPAEPAAASCRAVGSTGSQQIRVQRTFLDDFDKLDLSSNRWTPYYDGGYDAKNRRWQGYDWVVKRTQPAMKEQQIYVDPNYKGATGSALRLNPFKVENGILTITADQIPEHLFKALPGFQYTSGVLTTRRSFTQMYGYFEMRGKVPAGPHLLPAFWMLADDRTWPQELDVMEAPTHLPNAIATTVHWSEIKGQYKGDGCKTIVPGYDKEFHYYGALWTPERVVYYIDRKPVAQIITPASFVKPMYMIVNLAVGGTWVGAATPETPMPAKFEVDNISAYTMGDPTNCNVAADGVKSCQGK
jgi:beta-glucanase (GH16 family)